MDTEMVKVGKIWSKKSKTS